MLEVNNTTKERIDAKALALVADKFARAYKLKGGISLAIVGPARIKGLNRDYRGLDKATDVLSFTEEKEIVINLADTRKPVKYRAMFSELGLDTKPMESGPRRKKLERYILLFLLVHGLLHLAGYDDKAEKGRLEMIRRGRDFLDRAGLGI